MRWRKEASDLFEVQYDGSCMQRASGLLEEIVPVPTKAVHIRMAWNGSLVPQGGC